MTPGQAAALRALAGKLKALAPQQHIPHQSSSPCPPGPVASLGLGEGITLLSPAYPWGEQLPAAFRLLEVKKRGWQVAGTKPRVTVTPLCRLWHCQGSGGSGCPGVGGWGAGVSRWDPPVAFSPVGTSTQPDKSCLRLPLLLEKWRNTKERGRRAGSDGRERGREGESPMPGVNPSSSRRGISNNNRPWSRPDGFDLITKQGGLGSFQSLPKGRILGKQQRAMQMV